MSHLRLTRGFKCLQVEITQVVKSTKTIRVRKKEREKVHFGQLKNEIIQLTEYVYMEAKNI